MSLSFCEKLYRYLATNHLRDGALIGPDPGVRFNYRFWRFAKSALPFIPWQDDLYYLQAQGYWVLANWGLYDSGQDSYKSAALSCSNRIVQNQRPDGAWDYPNPEWRGRVATVEGIWASLALLESYRQTQDGAYLAAALRWHDFFESKIGFQLVEDCIAVNYFAHEVSELVPNNSALALRYLAAFYQATGDAHYLNRCKGLLAFIQHSQKASGEVPYVVGSPKMEHFQCFQYHAFMLMDVLEYHRLTNDVNAIRILAGMAKFLCEGLSRRGEAYYQCGNRYRTVNYHSAAVATALTQVASQSWLSNHSMLCSESLRFDSKRAFDQLIIQQRSDGSLPHSRGDYRVLSDRRSYPRYLSMILYHSILNERFGQTGEGANALVSLHPPRRSLETQA